MTKQEMNLRRLSNEEYDEAEAKAKWSFDQCPTCGTTREEVQPGVWGWENGTYRLWGEEYNCDCSNQMALYRQYVVANIPEEYMRLNWLDYDGSQEARDAVKKYLGSWDSAKINGMGLEFRSPGQGSGKTFAATHIAKELIKHGERVYYIQFPDLISSYQKSDSEAFEHKMKGATVLVLDDIQKPYYESQHHLFSSKFEELIRFRTNGNLPTLATTNLTEAELEQHYSRSYSLLAHKQIVVDVVGEDARRGKVKMENIELIENNEVRPLY